MSVLHLNKTMSKPVVFLDFDGVCNVIEWEVKDGVLTHKQMNGQRLTGLKSIALLNELYTGVPYDIVVTSTWRLSRTVEQLAEILYNAHLNKDIKILGKTCSMGWSKTRGLEIQKWIDDNQFTGEFIILDDDNDMHHLMDRLVLCHSHDGFGWREYFAAIDMLKEENND